MNNTNPDKFSFINPNKIPFFYGYVIAIIGSIGVWASMPGQTVGVSVFTDPVKDALGLTRNQFSNAYMIGTFLSSLVIGRAGKWFDKYGARYVATGAALVLALSLLLSSWSVIMSDFIKNMLNSSTWLIPFTVISILFFMIRFSGQGVLTMASRNVIMIWFDKNRGKVNSFSSIAISLGFSSSPIWMFSLIENFGWQKAWQILAVGLVVIGFILFQFYRDNPEVHQMLPDGEKIDETNASETIKIVGKQFTLQEAKQTRAFWMYGLTMAFQSFFYTGFTFHIISIFASNGFSQEQAVAVFIPISIISVSISAIFNALSDYLSLKIYLFIQIIGGFFAAVGFLFLAEPFGLYLLIGGMGILGGFFSILNAVAWPRFFGRKHLGAITGKIMSFLVLASAIAPSLFSLLFTQFGSYKFIAYIALLFLVFLFLGSLKANNPQKAIN
jgi:MFS family permease